MAGSLGTIMGQVKLDVSQALAAFAATRAASAAQVTSLARAGKAIAGLGTIITGAGLAMVAGFGLAVESAAQFDKKMSYVEGITHATGAEMDQVRAKALALGRDGQFSAGQIADGFVELAKAGVSVTDMTHGMADAMTNLASAADVKLGTAVEDIIAQLHTYNMSTDEAGHVSDELAGSMHASVISLNDMSTALKYAGSVSHALGITFDETTEAVAILGKAGIKGSSAGTQLRQIMVSLGGATKPAREELTKLGIITKDGTNEFFDATGKAKSLAQVFQILQDHTRGLNQEQQLMAFRMIFNNRALSAAEILTNAGAKGFEEMNKQIGKTTAAEVAGKRLDNLKGDIQKLKGSIDTMMIQAGEPFQNMLRGIVQFVNKLVNAFVALSPHTQKLIVQFIAISGAALVFIGTSLVVIGTVLKSIKTIKETYEAFQLLAKGVRIAMVAFRAMSMSLLASPITWIVIAIVALAAAFYIAYTHSKTFRDIINAIGRGLKTAFFATIEWFKGLPKFFANLWKDISNWFMIGVNWVKKNWDILLVIFTGPIGMIILLFHRFGTQILNFFKEIPGKVVGWLTAAWTAFTGFMQKLPYYIGFAIGWVLGIIIRGIANASKAVWDWGINTLSAVVTWFSKLPIRMLEFFLSTYHAIVSWVSQAYDATVKWATDTYNSVVQWFEQLPIRMTEFFLSMYTRIKVESAKILNDIITWCVNCYHAIINFFEKLPGEAYRWFLEMNVKAINLFMDLVRWASKTGSGVWDAIIGFLEKLPGKCWDIISNVIDTFKQMVSRAFDAASSFASGLWNGFKKGLGINSPSLIEKQMVQITKVTDTETRRLVGHVRQMQGLANQINTSNPAKAAAAANTSRIQTLTKSMQQQAKLLQTAATALLPTTGAFAVGMQMQQTAGATGLMPGTGSEALQGQRPIIVNNYNPVAERGSDSASKRLRTLSDMGAF